jgi:hypothetical protein
VQAVNGCGQGTPSVLGVTDLVAPLANAIVGDTVACAGQPIQYVASITGSVSSYNWTYPSGWTLISGSNSDTISLTAGTNAGNVTILAANGCGQSAPSSLIVSAKASPLAGNITGTDSVCINASRNLLLHLTNVSGADSIYWSLPNSWSIVSGQGTANITINDNQVGGTVNAGVYSVCGVANAAPFNVSLIDTPQPAITQNHDTLTTNAGSTYQWYLNGTSIIGATSQNYNTAQNGNYTVVVTNSSECTGTSAVYNYIYLSISNLLVEDRVNIFPNPSLNGIFSLSVNCGLVGGHLKIFDALSRQVSEQEISSTNFNINLSGLCKGVYLAKIEGNKAGILRRLIIE